MSVWRRVRFLIAAGTVALAATFAQHGVAAPTDPDDPQALERVWQNTLVVFPQNPTAITGRVNNLPTVLDWYKPEKKMPAVVFLHGCSGLHMHSSQVTRMVRAFAEAGFVVFAPNSMDRPRNPYCNGIGDRANMDGMSISLRMAELNMVRERIKQFSWVDRDNVFSAGHSLGGWTLSQYKGTEFRALAILGAHCQSTTLMKNERGVLAPESIPVIAVLGGNDEWFPSMNLQSTNCGSFAEMKNPNRQSLVLKGVPHDVSVDPSAMPAVVNFFKRHAREEIKSLVASTASSQKYDGDWAGTMTCQSQGQAAGFIQRPKFTVANGAFQWRVQVPAGARGFDGQISELGLVSAKGLILKTDVLDASSGQANVTEAFGGTPWPIAMDAKVDGERMIGLANWGNQPCTISLQQTRRN